jgi:hypothetical protein
LGACELLPNSDDARMAQGVHYRKASTTQVDGDDGAGVESLEGREMSEFQFETGRGDIPVRKYAKIQTVARKHGATFTNVRLPDGWRYWFSSPNQGFPFDRDRAEAVVADLRAARLYPIPVK